MRQQPPPPPHLRVLTAVAGSAAVASTVLWAKERMELETCKGERMQAEKRLDTCRLQLIQRQVELDACRTQLAKTTRSATETNEKQTREMERLLVREMEAAGHNADPILLQQWQALAALKRSLASQKERLVEVTDGMHHRALEQYKQNIAVVVRAEFLKLIVPGSGNEAKATPPQKAMADALAAKACNVPWPSSSVAG